MWPTTAMTAPVGVRLSSELPVVAWLGVSLAAAPLPLAEQVEQAEVAVRALLRQEAHPPCQEALAPLAVLAAVSLQGHTPLCHPKAIALTRQLAGLSRNSS